MAVLRDLAQCCKQGGQHALACMLPLLLLRVWLSPACGTQHVPAGLPACMGTLGSHISNFGVFKFAFSNIQIPHSFDMTNFVVFSVNSEEAWN